MNDAAMEGHLNVLQFLYESRNEAPPKEAICYAAYNGHLEVVKWLHLTCGELITRVVCTRAAARGTDKLLEWIAQYGPLADYDCIYYGHAFDRSQHSVVIRCGDRRTPLETEKPHFDQNGGEMSGWLWNSHLEDMRAALAGFRRHFPSMCEEFEKIQDAIAPGWRERMEDEA